MEIKNTSNVTAQYLKVLVHGPAGAGKTRLCSTTGGKPLILSAESGLLSLKKYNLDYLEITCMQDMYDAFGIAAKSDHDWICLDSVSEIAEVVLSTEKAKTKDPRKAYGEMQEQMMQFLRGFRDLKKNIYMSAKQERVKDEITGGFYFGPSAPGQKVGPAMPYLFDEVFAAHVWKDNEGKEHYGLQTRRDAQYEAKDRSGELDFVEPSDLGHIYRKIFNPQKGN